MKKVLISGASGFVGKHLAAHLMDQGLEVIGVGHDARDDLAFEYHQIDLLDDSAVQKLPLGGVVGVFHLAGLAAVGPSFDQPRRYIDSNAAMQINLFEACIRQDARPTMLLISSGSLYQTDHLPITEATPLLPSSPYAVSKITQEELGKYYGLRDFEVITARPFNHIGPGQLEGFLLPDLAKQMVEGVSEIRVGNLSTKRDYTDVRDIAHAYYLLMTTGKSGQTYNVCTGKSISGEHLANRLLELSGSPAKLILDATRVRATDIIDIYGSNKKLQDHTGWRPEVSLDQTLADVIEDWRHRTSKA